MHSLPHRHTAYYFRHMLVVLVLRVDFPQRIFVALEFSPVGLERLRRGFTDQFVDRLEFHNKSLLATADSSSPSHSFANPLPKVNLPHFLFGCGIPSFSICRKCAAATSRLTSDKGISLRGLYFRRVGFMVSQSSILMGKSRISTANPRVLFDAGNPVLALLFGC